MSNDEHETGRPLIARAGYVVIKPLSPATLRVVSGDTAGSRLEDTPYIGKQVAPPPLVIRELESITA